MNGRSTIGALLRIAMAAIPTLAWGSDAAVWFEQAMRHDEEGQATLAFAQYRRAAEAGLPQAEFNVAAMLDSGRGVGQDFAEAATWYARAAARGNARAAYNLGQLYESGEGVPRNVDLARAWFAASGLEAARARMAALPASPPGRRDLSAPIPVTPGHDAGARLPQAAIEFIWTSEPQPEPVSFFVELLDVNASAPREIFSTFASTTSVLTPAPLASGAYAWRVSTVARTSKRYLASPWLLFTVESD